MVFRRPVFMILNRLHSGGLLSEEAHWGGKRLVGSVQLCSRAGKHPSYSGAHGMAGRIAGCLVGPEWSLGFNPLGGGGGEPVSALKAVRFRGWGAVPQTSFTG